MQRLFHRISGSAKVEVDFAFHLTTFLIFVVKKEASHGCVEPSCNPKRIRDAALLDSSMHMKTHRFLLLQFMCSHSQPCLSIFQQLRRVQHKGGQQLTHHGENYLREVFHLKFHVFHVFNTRLSHGMTHPPIFLLKSL